MRLFDETGQELIKASLTKTLLHGGDAQQLFLIRVKACFGDCLCDCFFIGIATIGTALDQLPAMPFLTADCLLECILLDVVGPRDQLIGTGKDDLDFRILQ